MSKETGTFDLVVWTDKLDYAPDTYATFTAEGLTEGGTIEYQVLHVDYAGADGIFGTPDDALDAGPDGLLYTDDDGYGITGEGHDAFYISDGGTGDLDGVANGVVVTDWYVNPDDSGNETFLLTAKEVEVGDDGAFGTADDVYTGAAATTSFTDASGDFSIDFTAAAPETYNHLTGGGAYNDRTVGVNDDIVESLEGGDFACGDIVTYLVAVTVDDTQSALDDGPQTISMDFSFLADTTGQSGVALGDIIGVSVNYGAVQNGAGPGGTDSGIVDDGGSVATLTSESLTGPLFQAGSELLGTVQLTDLEAGEKVIVRIDVKLFCDPGSNPTGNLQGRLEDSSLTFINGTTPVEPAEAIPGGAQTIPFKQIGFIGFPELEIIKTVDANDDGIFSDSETATVIDGAGNATVVYRYEISNPGTSDLFNVQVVDDNGTPGNTGDDFFVTFTDLTDEDGDGQFDDLAAAGTATSDQTVILTGSTSGPTTVINTATATGDDAIIQPTTLTATDTAQVDIPFVPDPAIMIVKDGTLDDGGDGQVDDGDVINYALTVTNAGNVSLSNVVVSDPDADLGSIVFTGGDTDTDGELDVTETWTYTAAHTLTQAEIDSGSFTNVADADAEDPNETPVNDEDPDTQPLTAAPAIMIVKDGTLDNGGDGQVDAGDVINYALTVTNAGNVSLSNVVVSDPDADLGSIVFTGGDTDTDGELDVTETWTYTAAHTLTQAEIDSGSFTNVADADAEDPNETPVNDEDPDTQPLTAAPAIMIVKDGTLDDGGDGQVDDGDVINYALTVTNAGNVSLSNVVVSDPDADLGSIVFTGGDTDTDGELDVTETWTYTAAHTLTQAEIDSGSFTNVADADAEDPNETPVNDEDPDTQPLTAAPAIMIVKDGTLDDGGDGQVDDGDVINYALTVTNAGNVSLSNVVVSDPDADLGSIVFTGGDTDTDGELDVTETWTYTAAHTLTQAEIDSGSFTNVADADAEDPNETPVNDEDPDTQPLTAAPAIMIVKDGTLDNGGDGQVDAGDVINYALTVTNAGNVSLSNVVVSDPDADLGSIVFTGGDTDTDGELDVTETWTYTAAHTLTQAEIDSGSFTNVADADAEDPNETPVNDEDPDTQPLTAAPAIMIVKDGTLDNGGDGQVDAGDVINYALTVTNAGNVSLSNVVVSDPDADLGSIVFTGGDTDTDGELDVTETWTYTAAHTLTQAEIDSGSFTNVADADAEDPNETPVNDEDPDTQPLTAAPAIMIVKDGTLDDGGDGQVDDGDVINYALTVTNAGNVSLSNVVVSDPDADLGSIVFTGGDTDTDGELDVTETWTYTAAHTLTQAEIDSGSFTNVADADAEDPNETPVNDEDPDTQPLTAAPAIMIVKDGTLDDGGDGQVDAGDVINYALTVTNAGNVSLSNVVVSDPDADLGSIVFTGGDTDTDGELDVTETWTYTAAHTLTQAEIDSGSFTNVADADAEDPNETPVNDEDPDTQPLAAAPAIMIVKDGTLDNGGDGQVDAGDVINYALTVTNAGNVSLSNVVVSDPDADLGSIVFTGGDTDTDGELDVTETWTYTAAHTLTQAEIDSGSFTNVADADAEDPNETPVNDEDPDTQPLTAAPAIMIVKDGTLDDGGDGQVDDGDVINYALTVTNAGNVSLSNVVVSDPDADLGSIVFTGGDTDTDGELDVTETWTYTAAHTLTQAEIDSGSFTNVADADAEDPNETPVNDEDPDTQDLPAAPAITIDKVTNGSDGQNILEGTAITWTYTVVNTGNVTLVNPMVTDDNGTTDDTSDDFNPIYLSGDDVNVGVLDVGEEWIYEASGTAGIGDYSNIGTATGDYNDGESLQQVSDDDPSSYYGISARGQITPTGTTCDMYITGTAEDFEDYYDFQNGDIQYGDNNKQAGLVNNANPGVFFYYTGLGGFIKDDDGTGIDGEFTISVDQENQLVSGSTEEDFPLFTLNSDGLKLFEIHDLNQNGMIDAGDTCEQVQLVFDAKGKNVSNAEYNIDNGDVTLTYLDADPDALYVVSIKYETSAVVGTRFAAKGFDPNDAPTINYSFATSYEGELAETDDQGGVNLSYKFDPNPDALTLDGTPISGGDVLTDTALAKVVDAAIDYWDDQGVDDGDLRKLANTDVRIEDLGDSLLGKTTGLVVRLDDDAAGYGWSDSLEDVHADQLDLLSALIHEFGHVLGYDHDVMDGTLAVGERDLALDDAQDTELWGIEEDLLFG